MVLTNVHFVRVRITDHSFQSRQFFSISHVVRLLTYAAVISYQPLVLGLSPEPGVTFT